MKGYRVLIRPTFIAPASPKDKPTIADEGSIVEVMDMHTLFRDWISPITRRADEILVRYGKPGKPAALGWLARDAPTHMKSVKGPLFLVKTRDYKRLSPWDQIRYAVARADARQLHKHRWWLVPWCVAFGEEYLPQIKKAIREFGGRYDKKSQEPDTHCSHLVRLILNLKEFDMSSARAETKGGKKSSKSSKKTAAEKVSKKDKKNKKEKGGSHDVPDDAIIVRLVKENPRRAGTKRAKIWDKLRKGNTVAEFIERGGSKHQVRRYLEKGWVKLKKAASE